MQSQDDLEVMARRVRRAVALFLLVLSVLVLTLVLRGIVRTLLARPEASGPAAADLVPTASPPDLARCAADLNQLESDFRETSAKWFGAPSTQRAPEWVAVIRPLETRRLEILETCALDEPPVHPAAQALTRAASELEEAFGAVGLLWERHRTHGWIHIGAAEAALDEARRHLEARPPP